MTKHGNSCHPLYIIRQTILCSVRNGNCTMCDRWLDPKEGVTNFINDLEPAYDDYTDKHGVSPSLARIDHKCKVYSPETCEFTDTVTARSRQSSMIRVVLDGEVLSESAASLKLGKHRLFLRYCRVNGIPTSGYKVTYL